MGARRAQLGFQSSRGLVGFEFEFGFGFGFGLFGWLSKVDPKLGSMLGWPPFFLIGCVEQLAARASMEWDWTCYLGDGMLEKVGPKSGSMLGWSPFFYSGVWSN
jgi:hypothetical protein